MHYITNEGTGQEVILVHGNSLSSGMWKAQLEDRSLAHLHLIAIDLPGHGASPKYEQDTLYSFESFTDSIAGFVKDMSAPILVGHSFGGHLCMSVLKKAPHVRGLMIFGAPPLSSMADFGAAFVPSLALSRSFQPAMTAEEALELAKALSWETYAGVHDLATWILRTDPRVRADLGRQIAGGQWGDEQAILRNSRVPVCVANGAEDPSLSAAYLERIAPGLFWRDQVHTIDGAGHCPQLQQPEAFNRLLASFIAAL